MTFLSCMAQGGCEVAFALHSAKQGSPGRLLEVGSGGGDTAVYLGQAWVLKVTVFGKWRTCFSWENNCAGGGGRTRAPGPGAPSDCPCSLSVCPPRTLLSPVLNPTLAFLVDWFWPLPLSGAEHRSGFYCCNRRCISHTVQKCLINLAGPRKRALFQWMLSCDEV